MLLILVFQAKSNVVNGNKASAADPPQSANVRKILNLQATNQDIFKAEWFGRNIAALGQCMCPFFHLIYSEGHASSYVDFGATAATFQNTAAQFQLVLAAVTPVTPVTPSIPADFNNWLRGVVAGYPNGCTSVSMQA